jgi:hypothetical protein
MRKGALPTPPNAVNVLVVFGHTCCKILFLIGHDVDPFEKGNTKPLTGSISAPLKCEVNPNREDALSHTYKHAAAAISQFGNTHFVLKLLKLNKKSGGAIGNKLLNVTSPNGCVCQANLHVGVLAH